MLILSIKMSNCDKFKTLNKVNLKKISFLIKKYYFVLLKIDLQRFTIRLLFFLKNYF